MPEFQFGGDIVWRPSAELIAQSRLKQFMDCHGIGTLAELQRRSTENIEWFWDAVMRELDLEFYQPYERIVDLSRGIPWPRWCVGGKLNIVHNCLDKRRGTAHGHRQAIRWEGEEGTVRVLTYEELASDVCRLVNALRVLGMKKGDVAALFMPMTPETVAALFATAKLGGIILPLFPAMAPPPSPNACATAAQNFCLPPMDSIAADTKSCSNPSSMKRWSLRRRSSMC